MHQHLHKVADTITAAIDVPFVHIPDTTATAVREAGTSSVGLLATAYTMEQDFYVGRLRDKHGLEVLVPGREDRGIVHQVIYDELCVGVVKDHSGRDYPQIMCNLAERGAEAILLGSPRSTSSSVRMTPLCRFSTPRDCTPKRRSSWRSSRSGRCRASVSRALGQYARGASELDAAGTAARFWRNRIVFVRAIRTLGLHPSLSR